MKAYWIRMVGNHLGVEMRDTPDPSPAEGQVLVRVGAAALNRGEFIPGYLVSHEGEAKRAGGEAAGEIVQVGAGVSASLVGKRVMGRARGAFAQYVVMDAREAMAVPDNLSWVEAASIPLVFTVTYDMLVPQGQLRKGEWLLVTGVSSGVGVASMQLGKALGAKVIGTSRSAGKLEHLRSLGLDVGIHTTGQDFSDAVLRATDKHGADLVVNTVGGSVFPDCIRSMAYEGRLATVGYVDGVLESTIDIQALHIKRLKLFGVSNKLRTPEQRVPLVEGFVRDVVPLFASGRIRPLIDEAFPFDQLAQAKARMESNLQVGKIVLSVSD